MSQPRRSYQRLPIDPRDRSPDDAHKLNHDGWGEYAVTFYASGLITREQATEHASTEIQLAIERQNLGPTCGLFHDRDVQIHDLPHTGRAELNLQLRRVRKRYGRPVLLVQVWTHFGATCDEARQR